MPKLSRPEREQIARKRLVNITKAHGAALMRTIEQKISDAGPFNQRIDPHILTYVRNQLIQEGTLNRVRTRGEIWFSHAETPETVVQERIAEQHEILKLIRPNAFNSRVGETLEIAVYRALRTSGLPSLGGFRGLPEEPTHARCRKEEPPSIFGGKELQGNRRFDFLIGAGTAWGGIECKNTREWLYPNRDQVLQLIAKALETDLPPILIARRIPYVTRRIFHRTGMILWETRNQLYPPEADNIAAQVKDKRSLGYFDIRVTDYPDQNLTDFIHRIIPEELPGSRERFNEHRDLLEEFARRTMSYHEFAARVRRREDRLDEDGRDESLDFDDIYPPEPDAE